MWPDPPTPSKLTLADLPGVLALQAAVTATVPDGYVMSKTERDLCAYLDGTMGAVYGIMQGDTLTAMSLLRVPSARYPNPEAPPFPLVPAADWPCRAAFLAYTLVLPAMRGRGYQRALLDARFEHAAAGGMRWMCAGAHLANVVSWRNLLARGMVIAGMRLDFGYPLIGLLRPLRPPPLSTDPEREVVVGARADHARHQAVLADGFVGVRLREDGAVVYRRLAV